MKSFNKLLKMTIIAPICGTTTIFLRLTFINWDTFVESLLHSESNSVSFNFEHLYY